MASGRTVRRDRGSVSSARQPRARQQPGWHGCGHRLDATSQGPGGVVPFPGSTPTLRG